MAANESSSMQEDEIRKAAEIKEWLEGRIQELEMELSQLKGMSQIVDSVLRKSSFLPAAKLRDMMSQSSPTPSQPHLGSAGQQISGASQRQVATESSKQLRRIKDGLLLANAYITPAKLDIVPSSEISLSPVTPPFQTFFVNRILKGFEAKDKQAAESGEIPQDKVLKFEVVESEGRIMKVGVENYKDSSRLNEILSTATWAFSKMLEKK